MADEVHDAMFVKELRTGQYTSSTISSTSDFSGYLVLIDEDGNERKVIVQ